MMEKDPGSQGDHSAVAEDDTPATTTTTTTTSLEAHRTNAGGELAADDVNRDMEMDAGALNLQHHGDSPTTLLDIPKVSDGGIAMATREEELGGRVVSLNDDPVSVASQLKCPNLLGILRVAENRRVLMSVIPTLTLAIMGG